jgi:hypothetical protein
VQVHASKYPQDHRDDEYVGFKGSAIDEYFFSSSMRTTVEVRHLGVNQLAAFGDHCGLCP